MPKRIDLSGKRFGRLEVIEIDESKRIKYKTFWICKCDCGNTKSIDGNHLTRGETKSCGCKRRERFLLERHTEYTDLHKENKRLSSIWRGMRNRCYYESNLQYKDYGGRGIKICEEWTGEPGFANFVKWSKNNGYKDGLEIDRINVDGNYEPNNCRWATHKEQQNNRKNNVYIAYNGETKTLTEWCEKLGLKYSLISHRLNNLGLPFSIAISMDGLPKVEYGGKVVSIRRLAQMKRVDYKTLLHAILVNKEDPTNAVNRLEGTK